MGLGIVCLWGTRRYLRDAFIAAFLRKRDEATISDKNEPMSYRLAFAGLAAGSVFLLLFWRAAGMTVGFIFLFFAVYLLLSVAFTRVRAEVGPPSDLWMSPDLVFISVSGAHALGPRNLTLMALLYWLNSAYRNHPMPHQLEAFHFAERGKMDQRRLLIAMLLGIVVALVAAWWTNLDVCFREGEATKCIGIKRWVAAGSYERMENWLNLPQKPDPAAAMAVIAGIAVVGLLRFLRFNYLWWPLHPAGYALAVSAATDNFWMPLFLGWFIKFALIRYGGPKVHNKARPLFLGLILGDYVSNAVWSIIRAAMGAGLVKSWWTA